MMRMQPPKVDGVKNYYTLEAKTAAAGAGKHKKYQQPSKKPFGSKMRQHKKAFTTVAPRIMDGFYERSDDTMVFADESQNVYISARAAPVARGRNKDLRKEDLNTGEYLPETDFFVIDAKDLNVGKKPPGAERLPQRPDATEADDINGQRRYDHTHGRQLLHTQILHERNYMSGGDVDDENDVDDVDEDGGYTTQRNTYYNHNTNAKHVTHNNNHGGDDTHSGGRMEYQMHGFNGPDSYRFGFDTGNG